MAGDKEWSENPEDDPVELQKKQLEMGRKFLEKIEKQEADEKARQDRERAYQPALRAASAYTPPTFEEVSGRIKQAWDEVERIMPAAPDTAKVKAFEALMHSHYATGGFATLG